MDRAYFNSDISSFLSMSEDSVLGELLRKDEFKTSDLQKNSWKYEIGIMKRQLEGIAQGDIAFEYTIPRIGHRIDVVLIINGVIFLLEFKSGDNEYKKSTDDQVIDYALDLKYFHEESSNRYIIPISVPTEAPNETLNLSIMDDKIAHVIHANKTTISTVVSNVLNMISDKPLSIEQWINSRYAPTPTIIEAAQGVILCLAVYSSDIRMPIAALCQRSKKQ